MIPYRKTLWASTLTLFLAGCGGGASSGGSAGAPPAKAHGLRGQLHGGQQAVGNSSIALYAFGVGGPATQFGTAVTDASGGFNFPGFTCAGAGISPTALMYVTASGGSPGLGSSVNNTAIDMMAALGQCQTLSTVNIDEATTVAAAYALSGFITPNATVSLIGGGTTTGVNVQASLTNAAGITNAFATAAVLADPVAGATPASLGTSQALAQQTVYGLANSLAACVNTGSGGSSQCTELFACATPGASFSGSNTCSGGTGAVPGDTLGAALSVVHNPGLVSAAGVYDTATRNVVFSPTLSAAPNDWTLALNITGGGITEPWGLAIDASGDVWVTNAESGSVTELNPVGQPINNSPISLGTGGAPFGIAIDAAGDAWVANSKYQGGSPGLGVSEVNSGGAVVGTFTGGGIYEPMAVAIDPSGDVWLSNFGALNAGNSGGGNSISEFSSTGAPLSGTGFTGGIDSPSGIAVDASGNVWATNDKYEASGSTTRTAGTSVNKLNSSGVPVTGSPFGGGGLYEPWGLAIDPSGDVWITNFSSGGNSVSEFTAAGSPITGMSGFTGGGISEPLGVAIDASGDVWVANIGGGGSVSELNSSGSPLSPGTGFQSGQLQGPTNVAVDASGNVWVTNSKYEAVNGPGTTVTELIGAATPTRTPLVSQITPGEGFTP